MDSHVLTKKMRYNEFVKRKTEKRRKQKGGNVYKKTRKNGGGGGITNYLSVIAGKVAKKGDSMLASSKTLKNFADKTINNSVKSITKNATNATNVIDNVKKFKENNSLILIGVAHYLYFTE